MRLLIIAIAVAAAVSAAPALAQSCNPPPPGLSQPQWYGLCEDLLLQRYREGYGGGAPYQVFVGIVWQAYLRGSAAPAAGGGAPGPMVACSAPGQTYCPASGWLLTCNGNFWMTGAARC